MARLRKGARPSGANRLRYPTAARAGELLDQGDDLTSLADVLTRCGGLALAAPDQLDPDPRPDLAADHDSWTLVLKQAARQDRDKPRGVFAALFHVRGCGARLAVQGSGGWRIERGEMSQGEWAQSRTEVLLPRWSSIRRVLAEAQVDQLRSLRSQRTGRAREIVPPTATNGAKPAQFETTRGAGARS